MPSPAKPVNLEKQMIKCAKHGQTILVLALLAQDPKLISARDADGSTPLHCATWKGHERTVQVLLEHGADVNAVICATREREYFQVTPGKVARGSRAFSGYSIICQNPSRLA